MMAGPSLFSSAGRAAAAPGSSGLLAATSTCRLSVPGVSGTPGEVPAPSSSSASAALVSRIFFFDCADGVSSSSSFNVLLRLRRGWGVFSGSATGGWAFQDFFGSSSRFDSVTTAAASCFANPGEKLRKSRNITFAALLGPPALPAAGLPKAAMRLPVPPHGTLRAPARLVLGGCKHNVLRTNTGSPGPQMT